MWKERHFQFACNNFVETQGTIDQLPEIKTATAAYVIALLIAKWYLLTDC